MNNDTCFIAVDASFNDNIGETAAVALVTSDGRYKIFSIKVSSSDEAERIAVKETIKYIKDKSIYNPLILTDSASAQRVNSDRRHGIPIVWCPSHSGQPLNWAADLMASHTRKMMDKGRKPDPLVIRMARDMALLKIRQHNHSLVDFKYWSETKWYKSVNWKEVKCLQKNS